MGRLLLTLLSLSLRPKLRSYGVRRLFSDAGVLAPDFSGRVVAGIQAAWPRVEFLRAALLTT